MNLEYVKNCSKAEPMVIIGAKIPLKYRKWLKQNKIKPSVFIRQALKELIESKEVQP